MRKLTVFAATTAITFMGAVPAASADTPRCVSRAEFRAVQDGWTITRVHEKFDIRGSQDYYFEGDPEYDWPDQQARSYRPCTSRYGTVYIDYERYAGDVWRVSDKSAYW